MFRSITIVNSRRFCSTAVSSEVKSNVAPSKVVTTSGGGSSFLQRLVAFLAGAGGIKLY